MGRIHQKQVLTALTFAVLAITLLSTAFQFLILTQSGRSTLPSEATARASNEAQAGFCINSAPVLNVTCNDTLTQNTSYYCRLAAFDGENNTVAFFRSFTGNATFNMTSAGVINFTPTNDDVGNHSVIFVAQDNSGCDYSTDVQDFNFTVLNINDPPYLIKPIPDQVLKPNKTLSAFFLDNYFSDPDLKWGQAPLVYTNSPMVSSEITVEIFPTSEVRFFSTSCPGPKTVVFTATDPYGAFAKSNIVTVRVDCAHSGGSTDQEKGGGTGGGGGATNICRPVWECDDWMTCLPTGYQWQHCIDTHGCEQEKYFKRPCVYQGGSSSCEENWLCQDWGKCFLNSTQYRTCRDLTGCGTNITKPPLSQKCKYEATCDDGMQNGNETGIDCGGSLCPSCAIVQEPSPIYKEGGLNAWIIAIIILSILLISGIAHYYRAQIAQAIALLGFFVTHRTYKEILLDAPQRKSYFERVLAFEQLLATPAGQKMTPGAVYSTLSNLMRQYFAEALSLPEEALPEEVAARCKELALRPETVTLITGLFNKLSILEQEELDLDMLFVRATLEELRTAVCLTSDYRHEELLRPVEEIPIVETMSFYDEIFARSINVLRAVQYDQTEEARKGYLLLLTRYDPLSEVEKEQIYPQLKWLFDTVKFSSEMTGARVVHKPATSVAA